ncbi:hypothetical protein SAMN05192552_102413 [Natrinema hispanicum]|uniref:Uncharacterized protein n=1 Tax=Natrinema hispanicum TaxID=392421 RepID=A0A1G6UWY0_9EURY|nr:hypothetical protein SAMN05192552_102413 [Natrinema hispanicum]
MHRHSKHSSTNSSAFTSASQLLSPNSLERTTASVISRPNSRRPTKKNKALEARLENLEESRTPIEARLDAHEKKLNANKDRVGELQARELEKGAHLLEDHVDEGEIDVVDGRLERIHKDDGESYFRLPESDDPLDRGGNVSFSYGDLLPLQQLAKMDEDMLRATTSALPSRLAAKLWKARTDPAVGDNPWRKGSASVREYVTAGDMKHWIRRQEKGISDDYAKKLVSRTIDALLDLSKSRLAVKKRTQRKNGLEYTERRVLLMDDVDIPGEMAGSGDT